MPDKDSMFNNNIQTDAAFSTVKRSDTFKFLYSTLRLANNTPFNLL